MLPVIVPAEPDENEKRHDLLLKLRNDKFNDQLSALKTSFRSERRALIEQIIIESKLKSKTAAQLYGHFDSERFDCEALSDRINELKSIIELRDVSIRSYESTINEIRDDLKKEKDFRQRVEDCFRRAVSKMSFDDADKFSNEFQDLFLDKPLLSRSPSLNNASPRVSLCSSVKPSIQSPSLSSDTTLLIVPHFHRRSSLRPSCRSSVVNAEEDIPSALPTIVPDESELIQNNLNSGNSSNPNSVSFQNCKKSESIDNSGLLNVHRTILLSTTLSRQLQGSIEDNQKLAAACEMLKGEVTVIRSRESGLVNELQEVKSKGHVKEIEVQRLQLELNNAKGEISDLVDKEAFNFEKIQQLESGNAWLKKQILDLANENRKLKIHLKESLGKTTISVVQLQQKLIHLASHVDQHLDNLSRRFSTLSGVLHETKFAPPALIKAFKTAASQPVPTDSRSRRHLSSMLRPSVSPSYISESGGAAGGYNKQQISPPTQQVVRSSSANHHATFMNQMQMLMRDLSWKVHLTTSVPLNSETLLCGLYSKNIDSYLPHAVHSNPSPLPPSQLSAVLKGTPKSIQESSLVSLACTPSLVSCELQEVRGASLESILGVQSSQEAIEALTLALKPGKDSNLVEAKANAMAFARAAGSEFKQNAFGLVLRTLLETFLKSKFIMHIPSYSLQEQRLVGRSKDLSSINHADGLGQSQQFQRRISLAAVSAADVLAESGSVATNEYGSDDKKNKTKADNQLNVNSSTPGKQESSVSALPGTESKLLNGGSSTATTNVLLATGARGGKGHEKDLDGDTIINFDENGQHTGRKSSIDLLSFLGTEEKEKIFDKCVSALLTAVYENLPCGSTAAFVGCAWPSNGTFITNECDEALQSTAKPLLDALKSLSGNNNTEYNHEEAKEAMRPISSMVDEEVIDKTKARNEIPQVESEILIEQNKMITKNKMDDVEEKKILNKDSESSNHDLILDSNPKNQNILLNPLKISTSSNSLPDINGNKNNNIDVSNNLSQLNFIPKHDLTAVNVPVVDDTQPTANGLFDKNLLNSNRSFSLGQSYFVNSHSPHMAAGDDANLMSTLKMLNSIQKDTSVVRVHDLGLQVGMGFNNKFWPNTMTGNEEKTGVLCSVTQDQKKRILSAAGVLRMEEENVIVERDTKKNAERLAFMMHRQMSTNLLKE